MIFANNPVSMLFHHWYVCHISPISTRGTSKLTFVQLTLTIAKDLKLTQVDIANSNIIALVAT